MYNDLREIPNQLLSYKEKIDNDKDWAKRSITAFINNANFNSPRYDEIRKLRRVREGNLIDEDYKYVLNPLNTTESKYKSFPAKLRNYPLVAPVIELLLGELGDSPRTEQVINTNSDVQNEIKEKINIAIEVELQKRFINSLNAMGQDTGLESKPEIDIKQIIQNIIDTVDDKMSIQGQDALDFLYHDLNLDEIYQINADNYLVSNECFSYKDIINNNIVYEEVKPEDIYLSNTNVTFAEDCDYVVRKVAFTKNQLIARFYSELQLSQIIDIDRLSDENYNPFRFLYRGEITKDDVTTKAITDEYPYIIGHHVAWKSLKKEGKLTYFDKELGIITTTVVNDTYKLDKKNGDISIEWFATEETWAGYKLGGDEENLVNTNCLYLDVKLIAAQRGTLHDGSCKLPYNGRINRTSSGIIDSICAKGYTYQVLYNIYHYQHEMMMNKNKDKILMMPLGLIPTKAGWTEDKFMYMASALGYGFYDESKPNANAAIQGMKVIDLSLSQYAAEMYRLLQEIKAEFWDAIGMNRQRFGDVMASDGKANNEQAIIRSAMIQQELFRKFDKFKEKEANGFIDLARIAWVDGKKGAYLSADGNLKMLDIAPSEFSLTEFGVFAKNSLKEYNKVQQYKQMSLTRMQNNGSLEAEAEIMDTDNFAKIKHIVKKAEKIRRDFEQQQNDAVNKLKEKEIANKQAQHDELVQVEIYKIDKDYDAKIDSAIISSQLSQEEIAKLDSDRQLAKEKLVIDTNFKREKMDLDKRKVDIQSRNKNNNK